jgi:hypothetical protein
MCLVLPYITAIFVSLNSLYRIITRRAYIAEGYREYAMQEPLRVVCVEHRHADHGITAGDSVAQTG